jgi:hypothetical protein
MCQQKLTLEQKKLKDLESSGRQRERELLELQVALKEAARELVDRQEQIQALTADNLQLKASHDMKAKVS